MEALRTLRNVVIVDDHQSVTDMLSYILQIELPELHVVGLSNISKAADQLVVGDRLKHRRHDVLSAARRILFRVPA